MKITEEDLEEIFKPDEESGRVVEVGERVVVKKVKKTHDIKRIRNSIRRISSPGQKRNVDAEFINSILRFFAICGFAGFAIFILMSWGALKQQIDWSYYVNFKGEKIPTSQTQVALKPSPTPIPFAKVSLEPVSAVSDLPQLQANIDANTIKIEKINLRAPVAWNVEEDKILDSLVNGVAHYKGTSLPGEGGNVFIVGHSSNYFWIKSDYNNIFALLDKLSPGDRIEVTTADKVYVYQVKETKIVSPSEVQVLDNTPKETLSLMTCWPIGTSLKRMLVQSELVYSYSAN